MKAKDLLAKVFLTTSLLSMSLSCEKGPNMRTAFGSKIGVSIVSTETKSGEDATPGAFISERVVASVDGYDLIETIYENNVQPTDADTKGSIVTTLNSFQLSAYATEQWYDTALPLSQPGSFASQNSPGVYFGGDDGIVVSKSGTGWSLEEHCWLNKVPISFWCWNGAKPSIAAGGDGNYDSASLTGFQVSGNVTSQIDPLFAYNRDMREFNNSGNIISGTGTYTESEKDAIKIHFYHALAAINFDISEVAAGNTIDNIKLSNIYSKGSCAISVSWDSEKSRYVPQFTWTPDSGSATDFSQDFNASDFGADGRQPLSGNKVFLMVPQELRNDATITVTFSGAESSPNLNYS